MLIDRRTATPLFAVLAIVVSPALVSALLVSLGELKFSRLDPHVQTFQHAEHVLVIAAVAALGVLLGWFLAARRGKTVHTPALLSKILAPGHIRYFFYLAVAICSGTLAMYSLPGDVWSFSYSRGMEPLLGIGIYPVFALFGVIGLISMWASGIRIHCFQSLTLIVVIGYVMFVCLLFRGARLDFAGLLLAGCLLLWMRGGSRSLKALALTLALVSVLGLHVWGVYRAVAVDCDQSFVAVARQSLSAPWSLSCGEIGGLDPVGATGGHDHLDQRSLSNKVAVSLSTIGNVALSLYQLLDAKATGAIEYQYGESYLNYLPRTLPHAIYPDRPGDFQIPGVVLGMGSLYFLTEAYANFGVAGVAVISIFVGWLFGYFSFLATESTSFPSTLLFLLVFSLLIRVTWYQFFGLYKAMVSWALVEGGIFLLMTLRYRLSGPKGRPEHAEIEHPPDAQS